MAAAPSRINTLNLEAGLPSIEEARQTLADEIARASARRRRGVLLVIHGWGSSGKGGALRDMARRVLSAMASRGGIEGLLRGEDLGPHTAAGRRLLSAYPELKPDAGNPGVTIVEL
jgi:hypothetical protein